MPTKKDCEKGYECGKTCITRTKECPIKHGKSTGQAIEAVSELVEVTAGVTLTAAAAAAAPAKETKVKAKTKSKSKVELTPPEFPITLEGFDGPEKDDLWPLVKKYDKLGFYGKDMDIDAEIETVEKKLAETSPDLRNIVYKLSRRADALTLLKAVADEGNPSKLELMRQTLNSQYAASLVLERMTTGAQYKKHRGPAERAYADCMNDHIRVFYDEPTRLELAKGNEELRGKVDESAIPVKMSRGGEDVPEFFRNFLEEATPIISISHEALVAIDGNSGDFKNMYNDDAKNSIMEKHKQENEEDDAEFGATYYFNQRKKVEREIMGVPLDAKPSERPNYGILENPNRVKSLSKVSPVGEAYGSIQIQLKQDIKKRSSYTAEDSFAGEWVATPVLDPKENLSNELKLDASSPGASSEDFFLERADWGTTQSMEDYVEMQIFGGINLARDVDLIRVTEDNVTPEMKAIAAKYGIKIEVIKPWPTRNKGIK